MVRSNTLRTLVVLFATLAAFCCSVRAFGLGNSSQSDFVMQAFNPGADIRERSVRAILQARDGYLWLGTERGLIRFDGVTFTNFALKGAAGVSTSTIGLHTLWEDSKGVIWAGTEDKSVIKYDHGMFTTIVPGADLPDGGIRRIDGDKTGATWIFTPSGVTQVKNRRFLITHPELETGPGIEAIRFDEGATPDVDHTGLWRMTPAGVERFAYGHWAPFPLPRGGAKTFYKDVASIYEDALQRVWYALASQPGRYYCVEHGTLRSYDGVPKGYFVSYEDRSGYLWLTDHHGNSARWKHGVMHPLEGFRSPYLLNVLERNDGSFWLGSWHTPLFLLRPRLVQTLPTIGAPEVGAVLFRQKDGTVWAAGDGLFHYLSPNRSVRMQRLEHGELQTFATHSPVRSHNFRDTLSEDTQGHLLLNVSKPLSLHQLGGRAKVLVQPYPAIGTAVHHVYLDKSGQQWFATDAGLLLLRPGQPAERATLVTRANITCFLETAVGQLWAGTDSGPLLLSGGHVVELPGSARWHFGSVTSMDTDGTGSVWFGTGKDGLVLYRNHQFYSFDLADGLPTTNVGTVQAGDPSAIWLKTDVGLLRIGRSGLDQRPAHPGSELQIRRFDAADGLPSSAMLPYGNQGSLRLADGSLWFSTVGGIAALDPMRIALTTPNPHAVIEEHIIDQGALERTGPIELQPGQDNLELHYTGLGSDAPTALKFRYRLEGMENNWVRAGDRRTAYYAHLAPGKYRFHVQVANGDGEIWDQPGASVAISVLAPWYKKTWLHLFALLLVIALLFAFLWRRQRRITESIRLRRAFTRNLIASQETERKRIAHDLHDSLGQHLALILAYLRSRRSDPLKVQGLLDSIEEQAQAAIDEVQAISHNLRPHQLDRLGLTYSVHSLIRNVEDASMLEITAEIANIDDAFPKPLQINFYRIVQEALSNVLRHSWATRAEVHIHRGGSSIRLRVADNGKGFDATGATGMHGLGLAGILERSEALGGHAKVDSKEGVGTEIVVVITGAPVRAEQEKGAHV